MDEHGVTHAIIQTAPGKGVTNQMITDTAKKSSGRIFPLYWAETVTTAASSEASGTGTREDFYMDARLVVDELQSTAMRGMIGVSETTPISPVKSIRLRLLGTWSRSWKRRVRTARPHPFSYQVLGLERRAL